MSDNLEFNPDGHRYSRGGVAIPSVTTALKLIIDTSFFTPESARRGTYIHKLLEDYDNGFTDFKNLDPEDYGCIQSWIKFLKNFNIENSSVLIEKIMDSKKYGFAGTQDRIYPGEMMIVDIKTGAETRSDYNKLQLHAYKQLAAENVKPGNWRLINFFPGDNGTYRIKEYKFKKADFNDFLCCLRVLKFKN